MIQLRSVIKSADNTGAQKLRVILVHGGSKRRFGKIGDLVTASVLKAAPQGMVKKGKMVKALIVRTKKEFRRPDGSYIRFDDNAAVILDETKKKEPKGTKIIGPLPREIKDLGYDKMASLAEEVL